MTTNLSTSPAGCPVPHGDKAHHGYEPFDQNDPFPAYAELRAEAPVFFDERIGYWVVTRYDDIKAVFEDWQTFSSENAQAPVRERGAEATRIMTEGGFTAYSGLSARVPPDHTRIRKIASKAFTPRGGTRFSSPASAHRSSACWRTCWSARGTRATSSPTWRTRFRR